MKEEKLLYIHIPFCKQKCFYCDFPSFSQIDYLRDDYLKALDIECEKKAKDTYESLFIGGGTPSYLNEKELKVLFKTIKKIKFKENAEKTIECNPGSVTKEKLEIIKSGGINRISFGLQTTNNSLLKEIGRIHTFEVFKENFKLAREVGFKNINVDLMFGLPNQSIEDLEKTLIEMIKLEPEHISFYSLIIEEGTAFYKLYEKGVLNLPSEEEERLMYKKGKQMLESFGYKQYEFSNYAKEGKECFHNIGYWKLKEYLGVGSSSSSFLDGKRIKNISEVKKYIEKVISKENYYEEIIENKMQESIEEFIFLGLRMNEGINKNEFCEKFGISINEIYRDEIIANVQKELIIETEEIIKLSEKGIEVSNYILSDFIK